MVCDEEPGFLCGGGGQTGSMMAAVEIVDEIVIPKGLKVGGWVLGWRWDCEESNQIWQSCSDVTIGLAGMIERALSDADMDMLSTGRFSKGKRLGRKKAAAHIASMMRAPDLAEDFDGPETAEEKMAWFNHRLEMEHNGEGFKEWMVSDEEPEEDDPWDLWTDLGEQRRAAGSPTRSENGTEMDNSERAGMVHCSGRSTVDDQPEATHDASACDYDDGQRRRIDATTTATPPRAECPGRSKLSTRSSAERQPHKVVWGSGSEAARCERERYEAERRKRESVERESAERENAARAQQEMASLLQQQRERAAVRERELRELARALGRRGLEEGAFRQGALAVAKAAGASVLDADLERVWRELRRVAELQEEADGKEEAVFQAARRQAAAEGLVPMTVSMMSPPFTPMTEGETERGGRGMKEAIAERGEEREKVRIDLFAAGAPGLRGARDLDEEVRLELEQHEGVS